MSLPSRVRGFKFTCYRCNTDTVNLMLSLIGKPGIRYVCFSFELDSMCPVMKGYIYYKNPRDYSKVRGEFCHGFELGRESRSQEYIKYLESYGSFKEFGDRPVGAIGLFTHRIKKEKLE